MATNGTSPLEWFPIKQDLQYGTPVSTMTSLAVRNLEGQLLAAIADCERDIRLGEDNLARLKGALQTLRGLHRNEPTTKVGNEDSLEPSAKGDLPIKTRRPREGSAATIIRNFAREALRDAGRPLNRVQLAKRLEQASVDLNVKDPVKRIGKVLWDADEFKHTKTGYWFADEPVPGT